MKYNLCSFCICQILQSLKGFLQFHRLTTNRIVFNRNGDSLCLLEKAVVREKQIERWGKRREEKRREERKLVRKLAFYNFCRIRPSLAPLFPGALPRSQCYHKNATIKSAAAPDGRTLARRSGGLFIVNAGSEQGFY